MRLTLEGQRSWPHTAERGPGRGGAMHDGPKAGPAVRRLEAVQVWGRTWKQVTTSRKGGEASRRQVKATLS